jgi:hypothetical protein
MRIYGIGTSLAQVTALVAPTCKTVISTSRTAGPQGQSNPSELAWLRTGMVDMGAMHESCALTDLQYRVGGLEQFPGLCRAVRPGRWWHSVTLQEACVWDLV